MIISVIFINIKNYHKSYFYKNCSVNLRFIDMITHIYLNDQVDTPI